MKKQIALMLSLLLIVCCFAACGDSKTPATPEEVTGEVYDTGTFTVLVPDGWAAFPATDFDGNEDPNTLYIYKDASSEFDMFTHAGVTIHYYESDFYSAKEYYDDVADIEPFTLNGREWSGYTYTSLDYPYTALEAAEGETGTITVDVLEKNDSHEIALTDVDVQALLASIQMG